MNVLSRGVLLVALLAVAAVVAGVAGLRLNHVAGYTDSGRVCLNTCNDQCATLMTSTGTLQMENCVNADLIQYHTAQWFSPQTVCVGPCGTHGAKFDWCFINSTNWDFCSAVLRTDIVFEALASNAERCAGPCRLNAMNILSCKTMRGTDALCKYSGRHYIQGYTPYRRPCLGPCERAFDGHNVLTCFDPTVGKRELCALPARKYFNVGERSSGYGSQWGTAVSNVVYDTIGRADTTTGSESTLGKIIQQIAGNITGLHGPKL